MYCLVLCVQLAETFACLNVNCQTYAVARYNYMANDIAS